MRKNRKWSVVVVLCVLSFTTRADIKNELNQMLGSQWGTLQFTSPSQLTPNQLANTSRVAASFGGMRMRTPVKNFTVAQFTPPNIAYGCNGIDLTLGSFSMVSKDELIGLFRSIERYELLLIQGN